MSNFSVSMIAVLFVAPLLAADGLDQKYLIEASTGEKPVSLFDSEFHVECLNRDLWRKWQDGNKPVAQLADYIKNFMKSESEKGVVPYGRVVEWKECFPVELSEEGKKMSFFLSAGDSGVALTEEGERPFPVVVRDCHGDVSNQECQVYISNAGGKEHTLKNELGKGNETYIKPYFHKVWLFSRDNLFLRWNMALDNSEPERFFSDFKKMKESGLFNRPNGGKEWMQHVEDYWREHKKDLAVTVAPRFDGSFTPEFATISNGVFYVEGGVTNRIAIEKGRGEWNVVADQPFGEVLFSCVYLVGKRTVLDSHVVSTANAMKTVGEPLSKIPVTFTSPKPRELAVSKSVTFNGHHRPTCVTVIRGGFFVGAGETLTNAVSFQGSWAVGKNVRPLDILADQLGEDVQIVSVWDSGSVTNVIATSKPNESLEIREPTPPVKTGGSGKNTQAPDASASTVPAGSGTKKTETTALSPDANGKASGDLLPKNGKNTTSSASSGVNPVPETGPGSKEDTVNVGSKNQGDAVNPKVPGKAPEGAAAVHHSNSGATDSSGNPELKVEEAEKGDVLPSGTIKTAEDVLAESQLDKANKEDEAFSESWDQRRRPGEQER